MRPQLVRFIEDADGRVTRKMKPEIIANFDLNPETFNLIRRALKGVVHDPRGTGHRARLKKIVVAGKTGTAQVVAMKKGDEVQEEEILYKHRDHAWFVSFAPFEDPKIAVSVLVEHGGHGGSNAAPIAKKIYQEYFEHYPSSRFERKGKAWVSANENLGNNPLNGEVSAGIVTD